MSLSFKKILSRFLLIIIPFLFVLGAELYLRYTGYGFENSLFITREVEPGKSWYFVNPGLKDKYQFTGKFSVMDPIFPDSMKLAKGKKDFRIFAMGGSTTQGYPYMDNGSFPRMLEAMLRVSETGREVEVVNLGVTAMNSHGVLDFMRMVPEYEPDLIVLYMGHNEFFGALGSASNLFLGENRYVVRAFLRLQEFKLYLLGRNLYQRLRAGAGQPEDMGYLMQEIVRIKSIPVGSPLRGRTYANFKANLVDIISIAKQNKIPIIITTVVSNLKDFRPFDSATGDGDDSANKYFESSYSMLQEGFEKEALSGLLKARDLDIIPFRAPSEINAAIRSMAKNYDVPLLDLELILSRSARGAVLGKPDIIEHLHPTFQGNYKIAAYLTGAVFESGLLTPARSPVWSDPVVVDEISDKIGFTPLDSYLGNHTVENLMGQWPFTINNARYSPPSLGFDTRDIESVLKDGEPINVFTLSDMHKRLGIVYYKRGDFLRAYYELNAASKLDSFNKEFAVERAKALLLVYKMGKNEP